MGRCYCESCLGTEFSVSWSEEDQEYIGKHAAYPSLSWLSSSREGALDGIISLVQENEEVEWYSEEAPS